LADRSVEAEGPEPEFMILLHQIQSTGRQKTARGWIAEESAQCTPLAARQVKRMSITSKDR